MIRPHERAVVERFGRYRKTSGSGVVLTLPFVHRLVRVDSREHLVDVGVYGVTQDDVSVGLDLAVSYRCVDPRRFVYDVVDAGLAISRATEANLRKLVHAVPLEVLIERFGPVSAELTDCLNQLVEPWGVAVTAAELTRIDLPPDLVEAMQEKAASERTRVALVIQAENDAQLAVAQADARCRARLVEAEADRKATIHEAEAEAEASKVLTDAARYRQECLAQARADAIRIVSAAIREGMQSHDQISVRYVEELVSSTNAMGADDATLTPGELATMTRPANGAANSAADALPPPERAGSQEAATRGQ